MCFADLSYRDRLIKRDLIPVSYWFEYLDLVFFYKCRNGLFNLDILKYVTPYSKSRVTRNSFISIDYKPNLTKTSTFRDCYFNRIILLWNSVRILNHICLCMYGACLCKYGACSYGLRVFSCSVEAIK